MQNWHLYFFSGAIADDLRAAAAEAVAVMAAGMVRVVVVVGMDGLVACWVWGGFLVWSVGLSVCPANQRVSPLPSLRLMLRSSASRAWACGLKCALGLRCSVHLGVISAVHKLWWCWDNRGDGRVAIEGLAKCKNSRSPSVCWMGREGREKGGGMCVASDEISKKGFEIGI